MASSTNSNSNVLAGDKWISASDLMSGKLGTSLGLASYPVRSLAALLYADSEGLIKAIRDPKFGALFRLGSLSLSLAEVTTAAANRIPRAQWPAVVVAQLALAPPTIWQLLQEAVRLSPSLHISDGQTVVRSVAFVVQTVYSTNELVRAKNHALLLNHLPEARRAAGVRGTVPAVPILESEAVRHAFATAGDHKDEVVGGSCSTAAGKLHVWFASHVGPNRANLRENQDAAWAEAIGDRIVFAVADGVSTSFGSRFAAFAAVRASVRFLAERTSQSAEPDDATMLRNAANHAQQVLTDCMQYALLHGVDETWIAIRGREALPMSSVTRLMENTLTRTLPSLGPALAATLIVGIACSPTLAVPGRLTIIRIGDGSAEIAHRGEEPRRLFDVDNEQTVISSALCPGPVGLESLKRMEIVAEEIRFEDEICVSTDGLTRGHHTGVMTAIRNLRPTVPFAAGDPAAALSVLRTAASAADLLPESDTSGLFEDNLTLVRIAVSRR